MAGLTAKEMEYEAKVVYEALASADAPGYTSRQWSIILTQAQEKVVSEIISDGWDSTETNRRIVAKLISTRTKNSSAIFQHDELFENTYRVTLPTDYMHIVSDTANDKVRVKPVAYDYVLVNLKNPFEKPTSDLFWRVADGTRALIITDGTELSEYRITYIKRPEPIITRELTETTTIEGYTQANDCKLDPIVHRRIVDRAGRLADAYVNNQVGYQLSQIEEQSSK